MSSITCAALEPSGAEKGVERRVVVGKGLRPDAWSCAEAALGRSGAAVLALAAFAGAETRGGAVRNPGGWVRRMAELAEEGQARLHRSVFGVLAETESGSARALAAPQCKRK